MNANKNCNDVSANEYLSNNSLSIDIGLTIVSEGILIYTLQL